MFFKERETNRKSRVLMVRNRQKKNSIIKADENGFTIERDHLS